MGTSEATVVPPPKMLRIGTNGAGPRDMRTRSAPSDCFPGPRSAHRVEVPTFESDHRMCVMASSEVPPPAAGRSPVPCGSFPNAKLLC